MNELSKEYMRKFQYTLLMTSFCVAISQDSSIFKAPPDMETMVGIYGNGIVEANDGGVVVAGWIKYQSKEYRDHDLWIIKTDQSGNEVWQRRLGGKSTDRANAVIKTKNGDFVIAGETYSFGEGTYDMWAIRFNDAGNIVWHKTYGGKGVDRAYAVCSGNDNGIILAGFSDSFGNGSSDGWVVKLDEWGKEIWSRSYGGPGVDRFYAIKPIKDVGYVLTGYTTTTSKGGLDLWILLINDQGELLWEKRWGGKSDDRGNTIAISPDGKIHIAGGTYSRGKGREDIVYLKLDQKGTLLWEKSYGGEQSDGANSMIITSKGELVFAGYTESKGEGYRDGWIVQTDKNGKKIWDKTYGGATTDQFNSIQELRDGGYIISGLSKSTGYRETDIWVIKTDSTGEVLWEQVFKKPKIE